MAHNLSVSSGNSKSCFSWKALLLNQNIINVYEMLRYVISIKALVPQNCSFSTVDCTRFCFNFGYVKWFGSIFSVFF